MPTKREVMVGLMFFASLVTFFGLALVLAGQSLQLGKETRNIVIEFGDIAGVTRGTPVLLNGQNVGQVEEIYRNPETRKIEVTAEIDSGVQLTEEKAIEVRTGLFGGSLIYISDKGDARAALIDMNVPLDGQALSNPFTMVARISQKLEEMVDQANLIVDEIHISTQAINSIDAGIVGRLLHDRDLADELQDTLTNVNQTIQTYNQVGEQVLQITTIAQSGDGLLPMLLTDSTVSEAVREGVTDFRAMARDAQATVADVRTIVGRIDRQEGLVGYLIGDPRGREHVDAILSELAEAMPEIRGTMANLNSITYKIDTGQGSIGRILNDDDLYDQLMNTLTIATRSLEDLRETSPITAFASLLFQAFQ